jgi:hypothetical protein
MWEEDDGESMVEIEFALVGDEDGFRTITAQTIHGVWFDTRTGSLVWRIVPPQPGEDITETI